MRNETLNQSNDFIQKLIDAEELVKNWKRAYKNEGVSIYQLKIVLLGTDPVVWRRIEIPSNSSLNSLSWAINEAMGLESYHLHLFQVSGVEFGASEDDIDEWENDKKLKVREVFCDNKTIRYIYDFGDGWQHEIIFEGEKPVDSNEKYPKCLDGEHNCPPEDVGGIGGFVEYKEAITDKTHPRYFEFMDWRGLYDFKEFSVEMTNFKMVRKKVAKNLKLKKF